MSLFLELILAYLCMLTMKEKRLITGEGPTRGLDYTTLAAEAKYPINFTQSGKRSVLSLHYNGNNSYLFVNATKTYQVKGKKPEIKDCALCLCNISKDFNERF